MILSTNEIKIRLLQKGIKPSELAEKWGIPIENLSRVINRTQGFVFPEIRKRLAKFLGVPISAIGREPTRPKKKSSLAN